MLGATERPELMCCSGLPSGVMFGAGWLLPQAVVVANIAMRLTRQADQGWGSSWCRGHGTGVKGARRVRNSLCWDVMLVHPSGSSRRHVVVDAEVIDS